MEAIPLTATGKVDRQPLRAEAWVAADPVWWRPSAGAPYRLLTSADIASVHEEFGAAGRAGMLP